MPYPTSLHAAGRKAAEERLQELFREQAASIDPATQSAKGKAICEAVAALPDYEKWRQLPEEQRQQLEAMIMKLEVEYQAKMLIEDIDRVYPEAKKP